MLSLRLANTEEISLAMDLLNQAKAYLLSYGNTQWDETYPTRDLLEQDIANDVGYLILDDETPIGYFCGDFDGDPCYEELEGKWLTDRPYIVVHRLGLGDTGRGRGLAPDIFRLIEELALSHGIRSFRIDTDRRNLTMQHLLSKCGFTFCGYVLFAGDKKLAYEKLL